MQRPLATRKRNTLGASPTPQSPTQQLTLNNNNNNSFQTTHDTSGIFDNQFTDWDGVSNIAPQYNDAAGFDASIYDTDLNGSAGLGTGIDLAPVQSSQLVRRNPNQQMVTTGQPSWQDPVGGALVPQAEAGWPQVDDDIDLDKRALLAKKDAQAKRKSIPPFVQKLSSFLDDNTNTELIRWSDDGTSFIVLDEDEFAKTLIPELFKHNNYASFVRQLNMYGFHKKVGLSDNSMKASENKRKTPSEYYNKFFRRGRPELLWLIHKPKNPPSAKRKREDGKGQGDSDDERKYTPAPEGQAHAAGDGSGMAKDLTTIPKTELQSMRQELATLQQQQNLISNAIKTMRTQNEQFYRQATAFQDMHSRHENSINAILTFLATFYNRSLEGQGNFSDVFTNAIPQNTSATQGNIVDMGDFPEVQLNMPRPDQVQRNRRQHLLLGPPNVKRDEQSPTPPATLPSSSQTTVSPRSRSQSIFRSTPSREITGNVGSSTSIPEIKTDAETPNLVHDNQGMMSVINAANSVSFSPGDQSLDFETALEHIQTADGNTPLTRPQLNDMISQMQASFNETSVGSNGNISNAIPTLNNSRLSSMPTLPILPGMPATQQQLDDLQRMQADQAARVQSLTERLQPLSPSGSIPGLYDHSGTSIGNGQPSDFDLDDWVGNDDYGFPETAFNPDLEGGLDDIDFGIDGTNDLPATGAINAAGSRATSMDTNFLPEQVDVKDPELGRHFESISSTATSPADSAKADNETGSASKRRKLIL